MKRFENAKVGDLVWSDFHQQNGRISEIDLNCPSGYPVEVVFVDGFTESFMLDGREHKEHKIECLFYTDAEGNKLTERPKPAIDWSKVEPGTRFHVSNDTEYWLDRTFRFFAEEKPWFNYNSVRGTDNERLKTWKYAEQIKQKD